ncbi:holdfast anchoring protein HfaA [Brevundimonas sp.]|uniref:holdfast anchoring protein HfaA n=1 Tax=Brevundimonas sp. TaxID=1871086 RepID=UPI002FC7F309
MRIKLEIAGLVAVGLGAAIACTTPTAAIAQQAGSQSLGQLQAGYGGSRYGTARATTGSTRDANGNRLIVDGIIQSGASSYNQSSGGVSSSASSRVGILNGQGSSAIGGASAIGNSLNVVVQGKNNTVIVNSTQTNTGNVSAGTVLNGTLVFP